VQIIFHGLPDLDAFAPPAISPLCCRILSGKIMHHAY
jgi:hypothetical protein